MFLNQPALRFLRIDCRGTAWWVLVEDLVCRLTLDGIEFILRVPAGFETDGASVPRFLWFLFPPIGDYYRAAVIHDYLYSRAGECSRFLADSIFRDAMREDGVPALRRILIYYAVRIFGRRGWRRR